MDELRQLGLDGYETKAYTKLAEIGASTSGEISRASSVPYGRIYPTLYSLAEKGYVTVYQGKPKYFMAVEPRVILNQELARKEKQLTRLRDGINTLITGIEGKSSPKPPLQQVHVIQGKTNCMNLSLKLQKKTQSRWRGISRLPDYKQLYDACRENTKRGVEVKLLTNQTNKKLIGKWKDARAKIRHLDKLDAMTAVGDKTDAVIRIGETDETGHLSVWLRHPALAEIMAARFDKLWLKAEDI